MSARRTTEGVAGVGFEGSYLWRLRQRIGTELVLMPAVQVLVLDEVGRTLLLRRGDVGDWGLVSGNAEEDMDFAELAVAELAEEAGLKVSESDLEPFACASDPAYTMVYPSGDLVHPFAMCFAVRRWTGEPHADGTETLELGFFDPERSDGPGTLPPNRHPEVDRALRLWADYRSTGRFQVA